MMKEIHEQPKAVQDTLNSVIKDGKIDLSSVEITEDEIKSFEQIYIVACGSAWHVGMAAQYVLEDMADIPVRVELASEFRYRKVTINQKALVIVISPVRRRIRWRRSALQKKRALAHTGSCQCGWQ